MNSFCSLTCGIFPHLDPLGDTVSLRVSASPRGWQKPLEENKKETKSFNGSSPPVQNSSCSDPLLPHRVTHLFAQPHLSRYYRDNVHFHHQQHAVEHEAGEHFVSYQDRHVLLLFLNDPSRAARGCQRSSEVGACVKLRKEKVRVSPREEAFL